MKHAFVSPLHATVHFIKDQIQEWKSKTLYQKKAIFVTIFIFNHSFWDATQNDCFAIARIVKYQSFINMFQSRGYILPNMARMNLSTRKH